MIDRSVIRRLVTQGAANKLIVEFERLRAALDYARESFRKALDPANEPQFVALWIEENQENERLRAEIATLKVALSRVNRLHPADPALQEKI